MIAPQDILWKIIQFQFNLLIKLQNDNNNNLNALYIVR